MPVWFLDKDGKPDGDPLYDVRFWMSENPRSPGKVALNTGLAAEVFDYPAGQSKFPAGGPVDLEKNKVARRLVQGIPADVLEAAAKLMGYEYAGREPGRRAPQTVRRSWARRSRTCSPRTRSARSPRPSPR